MKLRLNKAEQAFEEEAREFLAQSLAPAISDKVRRGHELSKDDYVSWHKTLFEQGWAAPDWPFEYGGTDWSPMQKYLWAEQYAQAGAPELPPFGINMVGPVIIEFGSQAQKDRFLPGTLAGDIWWCQGYSEPDAGSDLAALKTTATRKQDSYIVNGTKSWVTYAQHADWMFCLVRTGDSADSNSDGISFLLIPMNAAGVTINPVASMDGFEELHHVTLKDVKVSVDNLIGEEGEGWEYAKFLLHHERAKLGHVPRSRSRLDRLKEVAKAAQDGQHKLIDSPYFAAKLAKIEIELNALEVTEYRLLTSAAKGSNPGPEVSILKLVGAGVTQTIDELFMEAAGWYGLPFAGGDLDNDLDFLPEPAIGSAAAFLNYRKASLFGGSSEILKNVICKELLGLQQRNNWGLT